MSPGGFSMRRERVVNAFVGWFQLEGVPDREDEAELGYRFRREHVGPRVCHRGRRRAHRVRVRRRGLPPRVRPRAERQSRLDPRAREGRPAARGRLELSRHARRGVRHPAPGGRRRLARARRRGLDAPARAPRGSGRVGAGRPASRWPAGPDFHAPAMWGRPKRPRRRRARDEFPLSGDASFARLALRRPPRAGCGGAIGRSARRPAAACPTRAAVARRARGRHVG